MQTTASGNDDGVERGNCLCRLLGSKRDARLGDEAFLFQSYHNDLIWSALWCIRAATDRATGGERVQRSSKVQRPHPIESDESDSTAAGIYLRAAAIKAPRLRLDMIIRRRKRGIPAIFLL